MWGVQRIHLVLQHLGVSLLLVGGCDAPKAGTAPASPTDAPKPAAPSPASTPTSDTYNLRGALVQGTTRRSEVTFEVQDAQLVMKVGDLALTGVTSMKSQITDDLEILEVSDGAVSKGRLNHVLDKSTNTVRMKLPDGTSSQNRPRTRARCMDASRRSSSAAGSGSGPSKVRAMANTHTSA